MILQYLFATDMDWNLRIMGCIFSICAVLFAIAIHESAHGLMSYALGDSTAKSQGRLSLNPFRHLNPIGTIMLLFLGFGWANPVVVQASKFKKPRLGMALTAAAGPLSNFIFGFIGIFISLLCQYFYLINQNNILMNTAMFFSIFASINVGLGLFNLIPLPLLTVQRF